GSTESTAMRRISRWCAGPLGTSPSSVRRIRTNKDSTAVYQRSISKAIAAATTQSPGSDASREWSAAMRSATLAWLASSASMSAASRRRSAAATSLGDIGISEAGDIPSASVHGIAERATHRFLGHEIDAGCKQLLQLEPGVGVLD